MKLNHLCSALFAIFMISGCLDPNPNWVGPGQTDSVKRYDVGSGDMPSSLPESGLKDTGPGKEGSPGDGPVPDKRRPDMHKTDVYKPDMLQPDLYKPDMLQPDLVPSPDSKPWTCTKDLDCNDSISCTVDKCTGGQCKNTLMTGGCLIGKVCYKTNATAPGNDCSVCAPGQSTSAWTAKADGLSCTSDSLPCTVDTCKTGKCLHTPIADTCAIGGACYKKGDVGKTNSCQLCDPAVAATQWSVLPDKTPCASDGLTCTTDICSAGKCDHQLAGGCLISGKCIKERDVDPSDACKVCLTAESKTAYTFANGLPCSPGSGKPGMCVAKKCMGLNESTWAAKGAVFTSLRSVDYLPAAKEVWAVGRYRETNQGADKGLLVKLSPAATGGTLASKLTGLPINDIHHDMAVGNKGITLRYSSSTWKEISAITTALGAEDRLAVWGAGSTYYLAGPQGTTTEAIMVCSLPSTGMPVCKNQTGISNGRDIGRLFGTLVPTGQGPLWGVVVGNNQPEDIYYNSGSGTAWSTNGPQGCHDSGSNPCANTSWNTYDMEGSDSNDIWVVGSSGGILHYDGNKWFKKTNVFPSQTSFSLTAVYSSKTNDLVTVAGTSNSWGSSGRQVHLYNYNKTLDVWFGPVVLYKGSYNSPVDVRDIGGQGYNDLWLVGQKQETSGGSTTTKGWILQLK